MPRIQQVDSFVIEFVRSMRQPATESPEALSGEERTSITQPYYTWSCQQVERHLKSEATASSWKEELPYRKCSPAVTTGVKVVTSVLALLAPHSDTGLWCDGHSVRRGGAKYKRISP